MPSTPTQIKIWALFHHDWRKFWNFHDWNAYKCCRFSTDFPPGRNLKIQITPPNTISCASLKSNFPLDSTFGKSWFLPNILRKNVTMPTFFQRSSCFLNAILNSVLIAIISLFASNPLFETPIDEKSMLKIPPPYFYFLP